MNTYPAFSLILTFFLFCLPQPSQGEELKTKTVAELTKALKDPDHPARFHIIIELGNRGPKAAMAVPQLIQALGDSESIIRSFAASTLEEIGKKAAPAVPALIKALKDPDESTRGNAIGALGAIGTQKNKSIPAITAILEKDKEALYVYKRAFYHLEALGAKSKRLTRALIRNLNNEKISLYASDFLGRLKPKDKKSIQALTAILKTKNNNARCHAAYVLAKIGPKAAYALPALRLMLKDKNKLVQEFAGDAILSINSNKI